MPTPIREQALAAIRAALETQLVDVRVYRNRTAAVTSRPAVNMVDGGMAPNDETLGFTRYDMTFDVQAYVETATDEELGPAISEMQARIVVALMGNVTLNGIVVDIHERDSAVAIEPREGSKKPIAMIETGFACEFFTREGDPYLGGP